jgi:hypothetical protein
LPPARLALSPRSVISAPKMIKASPTTAAILCLGCLPVLDRGLAAVERLRGVVPLGYL